jgi:hypothetical protein
MIGTFELLSSAQGPQLFCDQGQSRPEREVKFLSFTFGANGLPDMARLVFSMFLSTHFKRILS